MSINTLSNPSAVGRERSECDMELLCSSGNPQAPSPEKESSCEAASCSLCHGTDPTIVASRSVGSAILFMRLLDQGRDVRLHMV